MPTRVLSSGWTLYGMAGSLCSGGFGLVAQAELPPGANGAVLVAFLAALGSILIPTFKVISDNRNAALKAENAALREELGMERGRSLRAEHERAALFAAVAGGRAIADQYKPDPPDGGSKPVD